MPLRLILIAAVACAAALAGCWDMSKSSFAGDDGGVDGGDTDTVPDDGELVWVVRAVGPGNDHAVADVFPGGDIIMAGTFWDEITLGPDDEIEYDLTATSGTCEHDSFIARYSADGHLVWAKAFGGLSHDETFAISTRGDEHFLVSGWFGDWFGDELTLGPGEDTETTLVTMGLRDVYIAMFDSLGNLAWATSAGGIAEDRCNSIATTMSGSGQSVATGYFKESATFGAEEPHETVLSGLVAQENMYVAAFDNQGLLDWAVMADGHSEGNDIAISGVGNHIFVTGWYENEIEFGPGEDSPVPLTSAGGKDAFLAKYDSADGSLAWVETAGGEGDDVGSAIALLDDGSILVTGSYTGIALFGTEGESEAELVSQSLTYSDVFVARYEPGGDLIWAKGMGGESADTATDIDVFPENDSLVVVGAFTNEAIFGPGEQLETQLDSHGESDSFIAELDASGSISWARAEGGTTTHDIAHSVTLPAEGSIIVAGGFGDTVTFGENDDSPVTLESEGGQNIFLMRLSVD